MLNTITVQDENRYANAKYLNQNKVVNMDYTSLFLDDFRMSVRFLMNVIPVRAAFLSQACTRKC